MIPTWRRLSERLIRSRVTRHRTIDAQHTPVPDDLRDNEWQGTADVIVGVLPRAQIIHYSLYCLAGRHSEKGPEGQRAAGIPVTMASVALDMAHLLWLRSIVFGVRNAASEAP